MYKVNSQALISQLQSEVRQIILQGSLLRQEAMINLERSPGAGRWSVAQVTEHLNVYARFYVKAIEQKLHLHQTSPDTTFTSGWLGNYFTKLMEPGEAGVIKKKMKSPSNAVPGNAPDAGEMLSELIRHQHTLLNLLEISRHANLSSIRVPTSLSPWIKLKLGDTFRFIVAHEKRHFLQIRRTLEDVRDQSLTARLRKAEHT